MKWHGLGLPSVGQLRRNLRCDKPESLCTPKNVPPSCARGHHLRAGLSFFVPGDAGNSDEHRLRHLDRARGGRGGADGHSIFRGIGGLEAAPFPRLYHRRRGRIEVDGLK